MRSATYELDLRLINLLLDLPVPPKVRTKGLLSWSHQSGQLNSLSSGSDKELIQLIDCHLDGSDHIL